MTFRHPLGPSGQDIGSSAPPLGSASRTSSAGTTVVGLLCTVAALVGWAYTVVVLTPRMTVVARIAPMPGGDGELFLWVAELRWAALLLAGLGLLLAVAGRRDAPLAALALTGLLIGVDAVLERTGATGFPGLATALACAAAAVGLAWWLSGRHGRDDAPHLVRRRLAVAAIAAACCAPLLLVQGTPAVNHPFLPVGLPAVTAALPALFAMVAAFGARAARHRPLPVAVVAAVAGVPALLLAGSGAATGAGIETGVTSYGAALAGPLAVLTVALLRRHPPRRPGRTAALWTALAVAAYPAAMLLLLVTVVVSMVGASVLFALAGTSYPADGLSVLPGASLLALAAGALVARNEFYPTEPPRTTTNPDDDSDNGPSAARVPAQAGADPVPAQAGADPVAAQAGADPVPAQAGADPVAAQAGPDPEPAASVSASGAAADVPR